MAMCKTCGEVVAAKDIHDGRCATCVKNNVFPQEEKSEKSYEEELILNFEQRHKLGKKTDKETDSYEKTKTEEQPKTQKKRQTTHKNPKKLNKGILTPLIFIARVLLPMKGIPNSLLKNGMKIAIVKK